MNAAQQLADLAAQTLEDCVSARISTITDHIDDTNREAGIRAFERLQAEFTKAAERITELAGGYRPPVTRRTAQLLEQAIAYHRALSRVR